MKDKYIWRIINFSNSINSDEKMCDFLFISIYFLSLIKISATLIIKTKFQIISLMIPLQYVID